MANTEPPAATNESRIREWARKNLTVEQAKKVMSATMELAGKAGQAASALLARLRNARTPEEMLKAIDETLAANKGKSQPLTEQADKLYQSIAARKKAYEAAPPARKKLMELELRNMMAEYKALERELTAFYDNEHSLNVVRGRLLELMAHGMRKLDESLIDTLTDDIEEAVEDAEGVRDAVRDLDKAGPRRERESDKESFADSLAGFETEGPAVENTVVEAPVAENPTPVAPAKAPLRTEPAEGNA
jgi:DNA repair exonuclease SbcCD ATPase subunit